MVCPGTYGFLFFLWSIGAPYSAQAHCSLFSYMWSKQALVVCPGPFWAARSSIIYFSGSLWSAVARFILGPLPSPLARLGFLGTLWSTWDPCSVPGPYMVCLSH